LRRRRRVGNGSAAAQSRKKLLSNRQKIQIAPSTTRHKKELGRKVAGACRSSYWHPRLCLALVAAVILAADVPRAAQLCNCKSKIMPLLRLESEQQLQIQEMGMVTGTYQRKDRRQKCPRILFTRPPPLAYLYLSLVRVGLVVGLASTAEAAVEQQTLERNEGTTCDSLVSCLDI
jgi:hypothetical protein